MNRIQKVPDSDISRLADVLVNAYPGMEMFAEEAKSKFSTRLAAIQREVDHVNFYGLYRNDELVGAMRLHDYNMNLHSAFVPVGGVGFVAVELLRKKEKIAKEMIQYFIQHYRQKGACMTLLYPFRVDFYKNMGFGLGSKMYRYKLFPASLPAGSKSHIIKIHHDDKLLLTDCYHRYFIQNHGMIERKDYEWKPLFDNSEHHIYGYKNDGKIEGYIIFAFKRAHEENFGYNDLLVKEFVYESTEALREMAAFLQSQADQINRIIFDTQDESFFYLLSDPRNETNNVIPHVYHESHKAGVGLMYRVINTKQLFLALKDHNFGSQTCRLKLTVQDNFLLENDGSLVLHVESGKVNVLEEGMYEVEIKMDVADFSSLIMGAVSFKTLLRYGLASISDPTYLDIMNKLFAVEEKPVCLTGF